MALLIPAIRQILGSEPANVDSNKRRDPLLTHQDQSYDK